MAWNGSGTFTRTNGDNTGSTTWAQDKADGDKITASRHDTHDQDLATGINACLNKTGENAMTGNLNMGGQNIINVGSGNATLTPPVVGTFLPTIYGSSTAGTYSYSQQEGNYTVIGDDVWFTIEITGTWSSNPSGDLRISLPFTSALSRRSIFSSVTHINLSSDSNLIGVLDTFSDYFNLKSYATNGQLTTITYADQVSNIHELVVQGKFIKN